jgi:hypothetical protein
LSAYTRCPGRLPRRRRRLGPGPKHRSPTSRRNHVETAVLLRAARGHRVRTHAAPPSATPPASTVIRTTGSGGQCAGSAKPTAQRSEGFFDSRPTIPPRSTTSPTVLAMRRPGWIAQHRVGRGVRQPKAGATIGYTSATRQGGLELAGIAARRLDPGGAWIGQDGGRALGEVVVGRRGWHYMNPRQRARLGRPPPEPERARLPARRSAPGRRLDEGVPGCRAAALADC